MTGREDEHESQQSRALYELSSVLLNILRSPPSQYPMTRRRRPQITVAGLASLMLGISLTLMLGGSVTFMLGFMLFPWVIGLVMVFYFVGLVSCVSVLGRNLLCYTIPPPPLSPPHSPVKDVPGLIQIVFYIPLVKAFHNASAHGSSYKRRKPDAENATGVAGKI